MQEENTPAVEPEVVVPTTRLGILKQNLIKHFGQDNVVEYVGELTLTVPVSDWVATCTTLHDHADFQFEMAIDLCGVDYSTWGVPRIDPKTKFSHRFAAVLHLLSLSHNVRLRVRTFALDDDFPVVPSVQAIWNSLNWFEREAFDMVGIVFEGHPDLRRILTDYGFIGHPIRKDFPVSGYVEMIYDEQTKRVIYQPVSIEPREITPRIIREEGYGSLGH